MTEPAVALFWGEQPFLLRLAAHSLLQARGIRSTEVSGRDWHGGETADLATPSLWGERRALLITECQALPEAGAREVRSYVTAPAPDALCILTLVSAARTNPPLAKAVQAAGGLVRQVTLKRQDLPGWAQERAHRRGLALSAQAASVLVATLGEDPAVLDQAVEQLKSAFPDRSVGPEEVAAQFQGIGEQKVWDLCDQAFSGRLPQALVTLRGLLEGQEDPLLILGGVASRLRDLLKVRSLSERLPSSEAARAAGLRFDWQVRRYREQGARFSLEGLASLHRHAGEADRAIKGGAPGDIVLAALVAEMAGERGAALNVPFRVGR
jgi:DNA polymerase III subunit delta